MLWGEMYESVKDARDTIETFKIFTNSLADLVKGNLRGGKVSHSTLCSLKRELNRYNMRKGKWRD